MDNQDTIAAIATPPGEGGVGIIRISGPEAPTIATRVWQGKRPVQDLESHRMYYGQIGEIPPGPPFLKGGNDKRDLPLSQRGIEGDFRVLDIGLIVWMKTPRSYTGEDVVELHAHGGPALLEEILQAVIQAGARLARPGEFTERAFLNGRMDLTQAEAVADLIQGRSELALKLARDQFSGRLGEKVGQIRRELVVMRAQLEAMIDYPDDEDVNVLRHEEVAERVDRVITQIREWLASYEEGRRRREGVRVVLVGRPNVGKSSLLNALLGEDRVIVHQEAGTTRDVVGEEMQLGGVLVRLSDTAGLRQGEGTVEREGIQRSWRAIESAELVCLIVDRSIPLDDEDIRLYQEITARSHLIVVNKSDLPAAQEEALYEKAFPGQERVIVSAKTGDGMDAFKQSIISKTSTQGRASESFFIANLRHRTCLEKTVHSLNEVRKSTQAGAGLELLAADLMVAGNHLGEITGEITHDEVLSEIFARFCLGK